MKNQPKNQSKNKFNFKSFVAMFITLIMLMFVMVVPTGCGAGDNSNTNNNNNNKSFEVTVDSTLTGFESYKLTVEKDVTIEDILSKINPVEGYDLVGVFNDEACTQQYENSYVLKAGDSIYCKFSIKHFTISLPSPAVAGQFTITQTTALDLNEVEYGAEFKFTISYDESVNTTDIVVKAGNETLQKDADSEEYSVKVTDNLVITIEGVKTKTYTVTIPQGVTVTLDGQPLGPGEVQVEHGAEIVVSYTLNQDYVQTLTVDGQVQQETSATYTITKDTEIVYDEALTPIVFEFKQNKYEIRARNTEISGKIVIPATYDDGTNGEHPVVIPDMDVYDLTAPFKGCVNITEVVVSEGITRIGIQAFYECSGLTKVTLPESLITIDKSAFGCCYKLNEVIMPSVTEIAGSAFYSCKLSNGITLPEGLTTIGPNAFASTSLTSITLPYGVTSLGEGVFSRSQLQTISLPESITYIPNAMFYGSKLTSIVIPEGVKSISSYAFENCIYLREISFPSTLLSTKVDSTAFNVLSVLHNVVINSKSMYEGFLNKTALQKAWTNTWSDSSKPNTIRVLKSIVDSSTYSGIKDISDMSTDENYPDYYIFTYRKKEV